MPAVIGELGAGVVLGNLGLLGWHGLEPLLATPGLEILAEIGVLFLLFEVGLESDLRAMVAVGGSSLLVATLGVVVPMGLGFLVSRGFFPTHAGVAHAFVGATLCATSVGITARVLSDLRRTASAEGRIILGAAVIDDVLGLLVLAVVTGVIAAANQGGTLALPSLLGIVVKAVLFLAAAIGLGRWLSRPVFRFAARQPNDGALLSLSLAFCFLMALLAQLAGLAPIVGAFAAGLVLDEAEIRSAGLERGRDDRGIAGRMKPLATFLVPVFFVLMGARVNLSSVAVPGMLAFAAALTLAAIAGKQVCSLGVMTRGVDRLAVGLGMIPRGEVGLIFAGIGSTLSIRGERVIEPAVYAAIVAMVTITTLVTPPLLAWRLGRTR